MAGPVSAVRATWIVGFEVVPVKYPVSHRMIPASSTPMTTASVATTRGSPVWSARAVETPLRAENLVGR